MNRFVGLSRRLILSVGAATLTGLSWAGPLSVTPSSFDFGWAPENAKITADFIVKNTGTDPVPVTAVEPTCGCTAADFTPVTLAAQGDKKISLTFNTRGYNGLPFTKTAKVKSENPTEQQNITLVGHVTDTNADVAPTGDGVAAFEPGSTSRRGTITVKNRLSEPVTLEMVQKPAAWATLKLDSKTAKAGGTAVITASIDGSVDETRETSATFAATGPTHSTRFTVVVRSGTPPPSLRRSVVPSASPSASPSATPKPKSH